MNALISTLSPSATSMIRLDHTHVLATFHQYRIDTPAATKRALVNTTCLALEIHAQLEEEIFYPAMRAVATDAAVIDKSVPEHDEMRRLIAELRSLEPRDPRYDACYMELMRSVLHHVADEETVLLPQAERLIPEQLGELGARMTRRRLALAAPKAGQIVVNTLTAMPAKALMMAIGVMLAGAYMMERGARTHR